MDEVTTDSPHGARLFRADTSQKYSGDPAGPATVPVGRSYHADDSGLARRRPRHLSRGGASAVVGDTDVFLYRSYAIVERLRRAVEERSAGIE